MTDDDSPPNVTQCTSYLTLSYISTKRLFINETLAIPFVYNASEYQIKLQPN